MNIGKTNYKFQINCDPQIVTNTITEWLKENKFNFMNKYGEDLYYCGDIWKGDRCFQYTINNNEINIYAWNIGIGNKFIMLDSGATNNFGGDYYKNLLSGLFDKLNSLNNNVNIGTLNNQNEINQQNSQVHNISQVANSLKKETTDKTEKLCNIVFWLSIIGLILSIFGYTFGIILYVLIFYFAIQGLKTSKRKKAITSIVLTVISILITIGWFILLNI